MLHRGTNFYLKKSFHANFFLFFFAFNGLQIILLAPPWCKDSKNEIRFEIEPWEGGEKIGQTDRQTDRRIFMNFNIDHCRVISILAEGCFHCEVLLQIHPFHTYQTIFIKMIFFNLKIKVHDGSILKFT